jgi:hypothetical protein
VPRLRRWRGGCRQRESQRFCRQQQSNDCPVPKNGTGRYNIKSDGNTKIKGARLKAAATT